MPALPPPVSPVAPRGATAGATEGRLYALIAAGYVLGHCVIGSVADGSGEAPVDGAVRRLREIEQIGLAPLVEAAGPTAGAVAGRLVDASGAHSSDERRRAAWAVSVGIGLAATDGVNDA